MIKNIITNVKAWIALYKAGKPPVSVSRQVFWRVAQVTLFCWVVMVAAFVYVYLKTHVASPAFAAVLSSIGTGLFGFAALTQTSRVKQQQQNGPQSNGGQLLD